MPSGFTPRLTLIACLLVLLPGPGAPAGAQIALPGQSPTGQKHHLDYQARFDPGEAAPGDTVTLVLDLAIEDGWYIYDPDPITKYAIPTTVTLTADGLEPTGPFEFPEGKEKDQDQPDFHTRYHEGQVRVTRRLRVRSDVAPGPIDASLRLKFQICNDQQGVCLGPFEVDRKARLVIAASSPETPDSPADPPGTPETATEPETTAPVDLLGGFLDRPGAAEEGSELTWSLSLEPESVRRGQVVQVHAAYELADEWHVYTPDFEGTGLPTKLVVPESFGKLAGKATFPEPHIIEVDLGTTKEKQRTLDGIGVISFPVRIAGNLGPGERTVSLKIEAQVCKVDGVCKDGSTTAELTVLVTDEPPLEAPEATPVPESSPPPEADESGPAKQTDDGYWLFLLSAIGWGLFTLLMPCTYPMIPITISYFTKQAENSDRRLFPLALAYGGGIVFDFVLIGLLAGLLGEVVAQEVSDLAANPWLNGVLALAFVVFALSLFGLFEIRLPSALVNLSGKASSAGGYLGVFFLGTTLVITSFTCTAPFVGALLGQALQYEWWEIATGMGAFGATLATPFVFLGLFPTATKKMPRSGEWMNTLKVSLGFLELAAAFKFISNVDLALDWQALPRELFLLIWAAIALVVGLFLLGLIPYKTDQARKVGPLQMTLAVCVILFGFYCFYGSQGYRMDRIMQAIIPNYSGQLVSGAGRAGKSGPGGAEVREGRGLVVDDFEGGLALALQKNQLALVNWTGKL